MKIEKRKLESYLGSEITKTSISRLNEEDKSIPVEQEDVEVTLSFKTKLGNVAHFFEMYEQESENDEQIYQKKLEQKVSDFKKFMDNGLTPSSFTWAMENVLGLSKDDIRYFIKIKD